MIVDNINTTSLQDGMNARTPKEKIVKFVSICVSIVILSIVIGGFFAYYNR